MTTAGAAPSSARPSCSSTHCAAVRDGIAATWATGTGTRRRRGNRFGQLGRRQVDGGVEGPVETPGDGRFPKITAVAAGGTKDSGHTLLVGRDGSVWAFGCDRWQQLGLGSAAAGAVGYTWENGKLWQRQARRVVALERERVVAVAAGGDHSVALTEEGDVFTWGRGEHGQLGRGGAKPFVMPPTKSGFLSGSADDVTGVLALENCTAVLGGSGSRQIILRHAGKCPRRLLKQMLEDQ